MNNSFDHNAANERKWSRRALTFDSRRHDYFRFIQWALIRSAKINAPCAFLDIGCGTGWAVRHVATLLEGDGRFVGIDIASGMIDKARSNTLGLANVEFHQASSEALPFEDNSFDVAICTNSFHHYFQPEEALREVRRVLKGGGRIHILDVTADDFFIRRIDSRAIKREKEHVRFYSTAEYDRMFAAAGLRHVQSRLFGIMYPLRVHVGEKEAAIPQPIPGA